MANLASSAVSITFSSDTLGPAYKDRVYREVTLTLTGQGSDSAGSRITASVLGLTKITGCGNFVGAPGSGSSVLYAATPSYDGALLLLGAVQSDNTIIPTATTDVVTGWVMGTPV